MTKKTLGVNTLRALRVLGLALSCTVLLNACSLQPAQPDHAADRAEVLINIQQFGRALVILAENEENADPALIPLRKKFDLDAAAFEKDVIAKARKAQQEGRWKDAQAILQKGRGQYVQSKALRLAQVQLLEQRDAKVRQLRIKQFKARAKTLNQEITQLEKILAITPYDVDARQELKTLSLMRPEIAHELYAEARAQTSGKQLRTANELLVLSHALVANPEVALALKTNKRQLAKRAERSRVRKRTAKVQPQYEYLFSEAMAMYEQSLRADNLLDAKAALALATEITPAGKSLQPQQQTLKQRVATKVSSGIETGKYQYSLGDIDAAITAWEGAYKLAPDNDALGERLQRAHKFRRTYEALKN